MGSSILNSAFRDAYDLAFQISPIILQGGIAANSLGGMLPIIGLVGQSAAAVQGALTGGESLDDFFARYLVMPGGTLISNAIGMYPFANQQVAANAIIEQPLNVSLLMIAPVRDTGGYLTKLAIITSLQNSLRAHNNSGGTYMVATPGFIYSNCLLTAMTDVTNSGSKQKQIEFQLDFVKPLITQQDANSAYSGLMSKLVNGSKVTSSSWSGANAGIGSAIQGAAQNVSGMVGGVNKFLSAPL